jgi:hypothetical protein
LFKNRSNPRSRIWRSSLEQHFQVKFENELSNSLLLLNSLINFLFSFFSRRSEGESSSSKPLSRGTNIFNSSSNIPKSPGGNDAKPPSRGFFNNIGQYFSLSTETYRRPETPVFPLEQAAANNQSNTSESEGGGDSSQQPKSPSSTSVKSPLHKSEITGMSIFTFQFPLQISALFGGGSSATASAAASANNPNLLQEASNPVVERSSPPESNNNNNTTHRRKSADKGKQSSSTSSSSSRSKHPSPTGTTTASSPHSGKRLSKDILPKELIILDKNGKLYSSLEIFGLSGDHVPIPMSPAPAPVAPVKQVTYQAGDDYSIVSTSSQKLSSVKPAETTARGYNTVTNRSRSNDSGENAAAGGGGRGSGPQTRSVVVKPASEQQQHQPDIEAGGDGNAETGETTPPVIVTPSTSAIFQGGKFKKEDCVVCLENPMNIVLLPCR